MFEGTHIPISEEGKCLGYWWRGDLLATRAIDENMRKASRACFLFSSIGVFHGNLFPLSSVSILETCVVPILLYGSENWIMTESLMKKLESFQGELAKNSQMAKTPLEFSCHSCSRVANNEMSDFTTKTGQRLLRDNAVGVGVEVLHACVDDIDICVFG